MGTGDSSNSADLRTSLRTIPLFHGFTDDELAALGGLFERVAVDPARPLFDIGEASDDIYLLTDGEVVLDSPDDDRFKLSPPALIGELGALTQIMRSTRATVTAGATVWSLDAKVLQSFFASNQELGLRFLVNLLNVVADKVHRDQARLADMRRNLITTQKELKRLRELVLESEETPVSAPIHDALDNLITHNRRVNYRVEPPPALAAHLRISTEADKPDITTAVLDISRSHVSVKPIAKAPAQGTWLTGVLQLAGTEIPISGRVKRVDTTRMTIELDLLIDEYTSILEGYLTRAQLLDVLV
jgi:CRP-like cAMP-binding protein